VRWPQKSNKLSASVLTAYSKKMEASVAADATAVAT
jgi:hypothetical protein